MDVGIAGSRDYPDLAFVSEWVTALASKYPDACIVSGGARGVDSTAEEAAVEAGLSVVSFRVQQEDAAYHISVVEEPALHVHELPDVFRSFRDAAFHRNTFIAEADRVVAFWDGRSRGTQDTMRKARALGRPLFVYGPDRQLMS